LSAILCSMNYPSVVDGVEEATDVSIEHIIHFLEIDPSVECIQRIVLAAPWPEPIREAEKIHLVDGIQHFDHRSLNDLVFQRRDSERTLPPVWFRYHDSTRWFRSIRSPVQSLMQILKVVLQGCLVLLPCNPVDTRRGLLPEKHKGRA